MHSYPKTPSLVAALMACAAWPAGAAWADVTPEEVWQNWQDTSAAMGQTVVAGSVAREGDTLKIGAVTMASAANPHSAASVCKISGTRLPPVRFRTSLAFIRDAAREWTPMVPCAF